VKEAATAVVTGREWSRCEMIEVWFCERLIFCMHSEGNSYRIYDHGILHIYRRATQFNPTSSLAIRHQVPRSWPYSKLHTCNAVQFHFLSSSSDLIPAPTHGLAQGSSKQSFHFCCISLSLHPYQAPFLDSGACGASGVRHSSITRNAA